MPLYEGSCGCYNWDEAKQFGVTAAILLNWFKNSYRHYKNKGELVDGMFWHDQKDVADELAFGVKMLCNAIDVLEGASVIKKKIGYRPGTTKKTTWWGFDEQYMQLRKEISESAQTAVSGSAQTAVSILKETKNNDTNGRGSIIDYGMMKALIQKFVRDHQSQSNPIAFTPSKLKEYYPALKEWAIDNGINIDRQKVLTVLENAYSEMTNGGWLEGKDMAIAFKDTCIGSRIKKQQKKGGLNDNDW